jgi:hypothetical protein
MPPPRVLDGRDLATSGALPDVTENANEVLAKSWAVGVPVSHVSARAPAAGLVLLRE